uniref:Extracellular matrix phosphoglycoprotein 2 n=1 Tax=Lepisosteus oculatus TaxID=7918 RepID=A0A125R3L4_LEPOC|nr:extracellular matrix phosphoglycoprotein 2 [Lepisosteus oculatus]
MKSLLICFFLVSAASAMIMFRHPFRRPGSRCFEEQGVYYRGRMYQDGHYVYKYLYVFPPGQHPKYHGLNRHHPVVLADKEMAEENEEIVTQQQEGQENAS